MIGKKELENLILVQKLSYEEIGRIIGMTGSGVKKKAKKLGIFLHPRRIINPSEWAKFGHRKLQDITCPVCGKVFRPYDHRSKYCSVMCSIENLKKYSNIPKEKPIWDGEEMENMWKIDKIVNNHGYLYARCPQHPYATSTGYVYLHRLIVENHIGRLLRRDEVIHHKDGNKLNNKIDNLLVLSSNEHSKLHALERKERGISLKPKNPAKGKKTKFGRFDENDIKEIRRLANEKIMSWKKIAEKYGVTKAAIQSIVHYKTYKWVA